MSDHKYSRNSLTLMWYHLIWYLYYDSVLFLNNTRIHLSYESFSCNAMLFDVKHMRWFIKLSQQIMTKHMVRTRLCWCDAVSMWWKFVVLIHVFIVEEYQFFSDVSMSMWCCSIWKEWDNSFLSLSNLWTQPYSE